MKRNDQNNNKIKRMHKETRNTINILEYNFTNLPIHRNQVKGEQVCENEDVINPTFLD
jgi:hypothetical protein